MNDKIAATASIYPPIPQNRGIELAPNVSGVNVFFKSNGLATPIVTKITNKYMIEIINQEKNIPRGIVRPGFLHYSATLQILVRPPNEININPADEKIELKPYGAKFSKLVG